VASLIKTVLALKHKLLPPSLHFTTPNPKIDFANSPFFVNSKLTEWKSGPTPRRAGVSSFGLGGTNSHVVLEEAPMPQPASPSREWQLLLLSAKSKSALEALTDNLLVHFRADPETNLADAAFTLQVGRRAFDHRRMLVCRDIGDAMQALETRDPKRVITRDGDTDVPSVVFMFSGQGAQYVNMGADLYHTEAVFKNEIDRCSELLHASLGMDLRQVLYPSVENAKAAEELLTQTRITQPALFTIEFALATLWMSWGIKPAALIGHSIGEYVAACLAGVFTLEDALGLVAQRGQLMQNMPRGEMLAVPMPEVEVAKILPPTLSLATVNGPSQCVVSGPAPEIDAFAAALKTSGRAGTLLHTSHAFHSRMMDPVLGPFAEVASRVKRGKPTIPFLSNLTGTWITAAEATDPQYWAKHLRHTVRFGDGIQELLKNPASILLEVGPGTTLSSLAKIQTQPPASRPIFSSLRHAREQRPDLSCLLTVLGQLWLRDVKVDWAGFYDREKRRRISLPTYPFERERYWIESRQPASTSPSPHLLARKNANVADWFYLPSWKRSAPVQAIQTPEENWLIFLDDCGLGSSVAKELEQHVKSVTKVRPGGDFEYAPDGSFILNPSRPDHYDRLLGELRQQDKLPRRVAHFWSVTQDAPAAQTDIASFQRSRSAGFDSLLFLTQAICKLGVGDVIQINLVSNNVQEVIGGERLCPGKATLLGPCKVIPQEHANLVCKSIDVVPGETCTAERGGLVEQVVAELLSSDLEPVVAYRGSHRWVQRFEKFRLGEAMGATARLRERGVYFITGGFGKIGYLLAEFLAKNHHARLVLVGRSALPPRREWTDWIRIHGLEDDNSRRIQKVQKLEAMGAEVMALAANVANKEQLGMGISAAYERYGEINGIFHAAGVVDRKSFSYISDTDKAKCDEQFQPKVYGLLALEEVLKGKKLDFVVLLSTLSTFLGGVGKAAYSGANHFMDAFALNRSRLNGVPWIAVNWDGWGEDGAGESSAVNATASDFHLTPSEGIEAFRRILGTSQVSQIIVSTGDLDSRLSMWVRPQAVERAAASGAEKGSQLHARPNVQTAYVPVQTEKERALASIWEELLGIDKVGIQDNFFDLGGDSLLLMRVQVKISQLLKADLTSAEMFEHPTISTLARRLSQPTAETTGLEAVQSRAQLQRAAMDRQRPAMKFS
jgi:acyl transferase domain-containing protein